jgi:hypothetical protein
MRLCAAAWRPEPKLANRRYKPPDSDALPPALQVVAAAKEVSHPDTPDHCRTLNDAAPLAIDWSFSEHVSG